MLVNAISNINKIANTLPYTKTLNSTPKNIQIQNGENQLIGAMNLLAQKAKINFAGNKNINENQDLLPTDDAKLISKQISQEQFSSRNIKTIKEEYSDGTSIITQTASDESGNIVYNKKSVNGVVREIIYYNEDGEMNFRLTYDKDGKSPKKEYF